MPSAGTPSFSGGSPAILPGLAPPKAKDHRLPLAPGERSDFVPPFLVWWVVEIHPKERNRSPSVCLSVCPSVCLSIYLLINLLIYNLSTNLSTHLNTDISTNLSNQPIYPIYLSTHEDVPLGHDLISKRYPSPFLWYANCIPCVTT